MQSGFLYSALVPSGNLTVLQCSPKPAYSEISPLVFNGAYCHEGVIRIASLDGKERLGKHIYKLLWLQSYALF